MTRLEQLEAVLYLVLDLTRDAKLASGVPCWDMEAVRQAWAVLGPETRARFDASWAPGSTEPARFASE